jgi:hypothetical protein
MTDPAYGKNIEITPVGFNIADGTHHKIRIGIQIG